MSTAEPRDWISSFSSCAAPSLCMWQWKQDLRQSGAHVVPASGKKKAGERNRRVRDCWKKWCFKFFQGNTNLALCLCALPHTKEQTHFCSMLPSNKNQKPKPGHTPLWMAAPHVLCKHCKAWLSLLTISYSLTSLQNVASTSHYQQQFKMRQGMGVGG